MNRSAPALTLLTAGSAAVVGVVLVDPRLGDGGEPASQVAIGALRLTLLGLGAHAVLLGTLGLLCGVLGWRPAGRWASRLGGARWGLAVGVGAAMIGSAPAGATTAPPSDTPPTAVMTPVGMPVAELVPLPPATSAGEPADEEPTGDEWTVEQGDHLWSIAERVVSADHPGADDDTTARYWALLVEANRDRFVVPDDPDLILPGQRLLLPEVGRSA